MTMEKNDVHSKTIWLSIFIFLFSSIHSFIIQFFSFTVKKYFNSLCLPVRPFVCLFINTTIVMVEFFFLVCSFEYIQQTYGWHTNRQTDKCGDFFLEWICHIKISIRRKKKFFFCLLTMTIHKHLAMFLFRIFFLRFCRIFICCSLLISSIFWFFFTFFHTDFLRCLSISFFGGGNI